VNLIDLPPLTLEQVQESWEWREHEWCDAPEGTLAALRV
jgi:hypothetical protein